MAIDISTSLASQHLASCLYNASGPLCTSAEDLHALGQSASAAILSKSSTLEKRLGNPQPRYVETALGSINSMGLPNMGQAYYAQLVSELQVYNKPYIVSVAGLSLEENCQLIEAYAQVEQGIAAIELNLSCPNVPGKPQTGYDFEQVQRVLDAVCPQVKQALGVKLPPYFDMVHFEQMAHILAGYPICFVTCINSIGNALLIDVEKEEVLIKPKGGFGGLGGQYVKPTALANVRQFALRLPQRIAVVACGGVLSGSDAFEHILCGARVVQVGTQLMQEGTGCFLRIERELKELMQRKGYNCLADFRGKLKCL